MNSFAGGIIVQLTRQYKTRQDKMASLQNSRPTLNKHRLNK